MKNTKVSSVCTLIAAAAISVTACSSSVQYLPHTEYPHGDFSLSQAQKREKAIDDYLDSLSPARQISQIFLINIEGDTKYHPVETTGKYPCFGTDEPLVPGGMLFFSYNINENPEGIIAFTQDIYDYCAQNDYVPSYTAIDAEGGLVNRLRGTTSAFPSPAKISSKLTPNQAYDLFNAQAKQISSLGFNMNLAPVSEEILSSNKDFLDTRSFGNHTQTVEYSKSFVEAFNKENVSSVLKHFPGNTNTDPHSGLPEITFTMEETEELLIKPFKEIISSKPDAILMSHARLQAKDSNTPSCLSSYWVKEVLRNQLGFKGLIVSDDIFMGALAKNGFPPEKACIMAVEAGVDVIMLSEKKYGEACAILYEKSMQDKQFKNSLRTMEKHVIEYKIKLGLLSLAKNEDGSYCVTDLYTAEEKGKCLNKAQVLLPENSRIKSFNAAKKEGTELYRKDF